MNDLRVLIVEDEPQMRELLRSMLHLVGVPRVQECSDGASAIAAYQADKFDIIMLDIGLPDTDGHTVLAELRKFNARAHIVLVTADDTIESIQRAISAGANGYVVKPYSQEKIQDVISNYLMIHSMNDRIIQDHTR